MITMSFDLSLTSECDMIKVICVENGFPESFDSGTEFGYT